MTVASYVYCIVKRARKPPVARVPSGVPGADRPSPVEFAPSLWLVVSSVPLDQYGPQPLARRLGDLDWVGAIALAHESVVEHFVQQRGSTVVPMKLLTMFSSPRKAVAEMRRLKRRITGVLDRIAGAEEWGVRVIRGRVAQPREAPARTATGAAFLAARKQARDAARDTAQRAVEAAEATFDALAPLARATRRRDDSPQGTVPPLLDAAFLVPVRQRAMFQAAARRLAKACAGVGAEMTLTGPWPAYNFVQGVGEKTA